MSFEAKSLEKIIVQVAIDSPLNQLFDYAWNEEFAAAPQKGQIVQVSFGRQECIGVVMQILDKTEYELEKIKRVQAITKRRWTAFLFAFTSQWRVPIVLLVIYRTLARWEKTKLFFG